MRHESSKTSKTFRPWQQRVQHRPEESQTGSLKLCRWQAQASPAKNILTKWSSKISSVAGPVKTTSLALWCEILSLAGSTIQNFVRGRLSQDYRRENLSLAGQAKTMSLLLDVTDGVVDFMAFFHVFVQHLNDVIHHLALATIASLTPLFS